MNRQQAIAAGAKTYDPARPCTRGRTTPRYVLSGACLECLAEDKAARHLAALGTGPITVTLKCHPDDAQVLNHMAQHLAAMRKARGQ
jgi:hypothetical protein